ncbi:hypothetical protein RHGRI_036546 [Rhododendron griersonianum]|uniref:Uncharacterized protein n=1 Tax=Rhododendron griersonianum TaxID=479676 RepID=A0AAV6HNA2_9ERIC|nr:hypothetical protein RHGRI_036546 [Rhododendron griersonianum]
MSSLLQHQQKLHIAPPHGLNMIPQTGGGGNGSENQLVKQQRQRPQSFQQSGNRHHTQQRQRTEPCSTTKAFNATSFSKYVPFSTKDVFWSTKPFIKASPAGCSQISNGSPVHSQMDVLHASLYEDVVICYDGTVRNVCNNSIIQFEYETKPRAKNIFAAGEPGGMLAATSYGCNSRERG